MNYTIIIQGLVVVIIIGMVYSLWRTTRVYGGLIGQGMKWIGIGMVFFSSEAVDRVLGDLSFVNSFGSEPEIVHKIILLFGLLFCAVGFSRLTKIAK